tara:strand:- start:1802 stop:2098 length:297 start_codon:yes stop_codon:yes gene_type:complete
MVHWKVRKSGIRVHPQALQGNHKEYPRVTLEIYPDLGCWFIAITAHPYGQSECPLFLSPVNSVDSAARFADLFPTTDVWPTLVASGNWALADGRHLLK